MCKFGHYFLHQLALTVHMFLHAKDANHALLIFLQIGNCVGATNHRHFIAFLVSILVSTMYVTIMSAYAGLHIWPPLPHRYLDHLRAGNRSLAWRALQDVAVALASSAVLLSTRGLVLVYLFVSSTSLEIGISVLLFYGSSYVTYMRDKLT